MLMRNLWPFRRGKPAAGAAPPAEDASVQSKLRHQTVAYPILASIPRYCSSSPHVLLLVLLLLLLIIPPRLLLLVFLVVLSLLWNQFSSSG